MSGSTTDKRQHSGIARHWGKATALALVVAGFLGWYDAVRNNGRLFVCDAAALLGQSEAVLFCRDEVARPDDSNQLELLEYLRARENQLSPQRHAELRRLEAYLEDRAFEVLRRAAGFEGADADVRAETDARDAVRETIEEGDREERRALALIAEGQLNAGLKLLSDLASESARENAAQWLRIGALAYGVDTERAIDAFERAIAIEPNNAAAHIRLSELYRSSFASGRLDLALIASRRGSEIADHPVVASRAAIEEGSVLVHLGRLSDALSRRQAGLQIIESASTNSPNDLQVKHQLGVNLLRVGELQADLGDLDLAKQTLYHSLELLQQVTALDPNNAGWQRDVLVSHERIGDVLIDQGGLSGALKSYQASIAIAERLADADPNNAGWKRQLSVSQEKVGDALVGLGDLSGALGSYQASMAIRERLASTDPNNAIWQRDLSVSHERIGDMFAVQGNMSGALESYQASMAIAERLADADPNNAGWQRDLSVSHGRIGDVLIAQDNLSGALESYQASITIAESLATADPNNAIWQRDLSVSHTNIGDVLVAQGDLSGALESYRASMTIRERLVGTDPNNAGWQRDFAVSLWRLAGFPGSDVRWSDVVDAWIELEERGVLAPTDRQFLLEARRRANAEGEPPE